LTRRGCRSTRVVSRGRRLSNAIRRLFFGCVEWRPTGCRRVGCCDADQRAGCRRFRCRRWVAIPRRLDGRAGERRRRSPIACDRVVTVFGHPPAVFLLSAARLYQHPVDESVACENECVFVRVVDDCGDVLDSGCAVFFVAPDSGDFGFE